MAIKLLKTITQKMIERIYDEWQIMWKWNLQLTFSLTRLGGDEKCEMFWNSKIAELNRVGCLALHCCRWFHSFVRRRRRWSEVQSVSVSSLSKWNDFCSRSFQRSFVRFFFNVLRFKRQARALLLLGTREREREREREIASSGTRRLKKI